MKTYTIEKKVDGKTIDKSGFFYYEIDAHEALCKQATESGMKRIDDNSWFLTNGSTTSVMKVVELCDTRFVKVA